MAVINKNYRIKHGLIVEGTTATVAGSNVLTETSTQFLEDTTASMFDTSHTGITFTYDDPSGKLSATVDSNPTFTDSIVFQGATSDSFETTLFVTDPTADHTITLPDSTGTVALTSDIPSSTDELSEGTTNKYYADSLVDSHLSGGDGITYSSGTISADLGTGLEITGGQIVVDRDTVDTWYDAAGSASTVSGNLTAHIGNTSTHGVTGDIVGTTDLQSLSNKIFTDGSNPFTLNTGTTYNNFVVAIPSVLNITEVLDIDALSVNITDSYIINTFNVLDFIGTNVSYDVHTMTNAIPYSSNHRHQITRI